ncbi:MAG: quinone-dependent dihydroorotate dehydrogenase [Alphaproteobacteria bacterium]
MSLIQTLGLKAVQGMDAERAHRATIWALRLGLGGRGDNQPDPVLATTVAGLSFPNPVGMAAGFDKNAEVPDALLKLGFGFTEVGAVTPKPQAGNDKPRVFRLKEDRAVINRMGFNNEGMDFAHAQLQGRRPQGVLGVNLGANKDSKDRIQDYVTVLNRLKDHAQFFTVNVSSPNTPGLRGLQDKSELEELLRAVMAQEVGKPIFLKIAPDLDQEALSDIVDVAVWTGITGLVISNTTLARPKTLQSLHAGEAGGLSGVPLFDASTKMLGDAYRASGGRLTLIGVGGVASGADAYAKIRAGASLVQLYSALVYAGPQLIQTLLSDLVELLKRDGFKSVQEAVGADFK